MKEQQSVLITKRCLPIPEQQIAMRIQKLLCTAVVSLNTSVASSRLWSFPYFSRFGRIKVLSLLEASRAELGLFKNNKKNKINLEFLSKITSVHYGQLIIRIGNPFMFQRCDLRRESEWVNIVANEACAYLLMANHRQNKLICKLCEVWKPPAVLIRHSWHLRISISTDGPFVTCTLGLGCLEGIVTSSLFLQYALVS